MFNISYNTIEINREARDNCALLVDRLIERNTQLNLTAIRDREAILEKHIADSLAIALVSGFKGNEKILDLGTGGGFPGLPIKIVYPDICITLLDSVRKKLKFVDEMIDELKMTDARTLWGRAEDLARDPDERGAYDIVVSRAVTYLPGLIECALPFLKEGGLLIAYKQNKNEDETGNSKRALTELNGRIEEEIAYEISGGDQRKLILIRKTGPSPDKYPRRAGKPTKDPLI